MTAAAMSETNGEARRWRAVAAASIGNALEWFDFIIYGFFAVVMAKLFFPTGDETVSLMVALAAFGVPFFMRPLGAIVIGNYADRHGRKAAFTLTILLMMVGTAIIAMAPTYATAGLLAPLLIVLARLIQGFSAGGEFGSATAFLAEQDPKRRGFFASWQFASQGLTTVLATSIGVTLTSTLTTAQIESWGWRVPFIIGLLIGPVAWYIRRHVDETTEFKTMQVSASFAEGGALRQQEAASDFAGCRRALRGVDVHGRAVHADLCDPAIRIDDVSRLSRWIASRRYPARADPGLWSDVGSSRASADRLRGGCRDAGRILSVVLMACRCSDTANPADCSGNHWRVDGRLYGSAWCSYG